MAFICTCITSLDNYQNKSKQEQQDSDLMYWFIGLTYVLIIAQTMHFCLNTAILFTSQRELHNQMVWRILRAPMHFFDTNSIGTILTKFTKDIAGLEEFLPLYLFLLMRVFMFIVSSTIIILIAAPFVIFVMIIAIIGVYVTRK